MNGWEYRCPQCGALVSSGWADAICPLPSCGAVMECLAHPEPTDAEKDAVVLEAERLLAR